MNKNILVVDDSESIRELISNTLENAGYSVTKGNNGVDGLSQIKKMGHVAMVITDLFMPEMDGIDMIRAIRNIEEFKYTPILMLTTESHMDKKVEAKKAGVTGWMVKPFEEEKLVKIVRKIIR